MAVQTVTLTEFLLARIAEDEQLARAEGTTGAWGPNDLIATIDRPRVYARLVTPSGVTEFSTVRALAECEAKRRVVEHCSADAECLTHGSDLHLDNHGGCNDCYAAEQVADNDRHVLAFLALPYAGHPDYRAEWRADA